MNEFLDYLEKNVTNLPFKKGMWCIPPFKGKDLREKSIQTLKKTIKKMKKEINKLSINLINIEIKIDYNALKKKIEPFKKELIDRCFYPTRVTYYIEKYTYDILAERYLAKDDWRL